jgi:hypothetical protein
MTRAFVSLIVILILAGAALAVNGLFGTEPGQHLASRCSVSAETGRSCQTGRSGYGIDDVALNEAPTPASPEPKARKRSATVKAPAEATATESAAAGPAPAPAASSSRGAVPAAPEVTKPVEAPAPVREASAWKDPVPTLDPAPAAKAVADQDRKTPQSEPARPDVAARDVAPKAAETRPQARPEPAKAAEPKVEPRPEPRVRTAQPKVEGPEPRVVAEQPARIREPVAREASAPRVTEEPKARRRIVTTRPAKVREPATEVASVSPPAAKPLEVAPARRPALVTERTARQVVVAPRRMVRPAPPAVPDDDIRVGVASAALVPPRPIPDRSAGSSAFPSDFQAALRHYNARYSMYAVRRAPWSREDD